MTVFQTHDPEQEADGAAPGLQMCEKVAVNSTKRFSKQMQSQILSIARLLEKDASVFAPLRPHTARCVFTASLG